MITSTSIASWARRRLARSADVLVHLDTLDAEHAHLLVAELPHGALVRLRMHESWRCAP